MVTATQHSAAPKQPASSIRADAFAPARGVRDTRAAPVVRPGLSRAFLAAWSCAALAVSGAHAKVQALGGHVPQQMPAELPPADIPPELIHREFARRALECSPVPFAPKVILPIPPERQWLAMASYSHALRYKADGSTRAMDVYSHTNLQGKDVIDSANADPMRGPKMAEKLCTSQAACGQNVTEVFTATDVRIEFYNPLGTSHTLPRFIDEHTKPAFAFVDARNALMLARKVSADGIQFAPLGGRSGGVPHQVPREIIDAEVANHGVIHRCRDAPGGYVVAFDSSLWQFFNREDTLGYFRKGWITCVDFPVEKDVPIARANITTCVPTS